VTWWVSELCPYLRGGQQVLAGSGEVRAAFSFLWLRDEQLLSWFLDPAPIIDGSGATSCWRTRWSFFFLRSWELNPGPRQALLLEPPPVPALSFGILFLRQGFISFAWATVILLPPPPK
jgi:hypothetical protein